MHKDEKIIKFTDKSGNEVEWNEFQIISSVKEVLDWYTRLSLTLRMKCGVKKYTLEDFFDYHKDWYFDLSKKEIAELILSVQKTNENISNAIKTGEMQKLIFGSENVDN